MKNFSCSLYNRLLLEWEYMSVGMGGGILMGKQHTKEEKTLHWDSTSNSCMDWQAQEQSHIHGNWNLGHQNSAKPEQTYQHTLVLTTGLNIQENWWPLYGQAMGQPPHTLKHISIWWMSEQTNRVCPWELCYNEVWTYKSILYEKHFLPTINGIKLLLKNVFHQCHYLSTSPTTV